MTRLITRLVGAPGALAAAVLVLTAALAVPFLAMAPTSTASPEPGGPVFDARDAIDERFDIQVFPIFLILEAADGDVLAPAVLREVQAGVERLRTDDRTADLLLTRYDRAVGRQVDGVLTVAGAVDDALAQAGSSLADAPDEVVRQVTAQVVEAAGPAAIGLSEDAAADGDGVWRAEALALQVLADNQALGGGSIEVAVGTDDTTREAFSRTVVEVIGEGATGYTTYGVANDVNLTAAEEGQAAGPFIGLTIVGVLLVVGLTYRSYWAVAVTGAGLAALIVWLRGLSNLIGLESDQILDTIVPIALISFGIDFAFHAIGRYREHVAEGAAPVPAVTLGLAGVMGALVLALSSDAVAFLSNTVAGIESIVQFGIATTLGLLSAFLLLGIAAPILIAHLEGLTGPMPATRRGRVLAVVGGTAAILTAMASVLIGVFVLPAVGVALLGVHVLAFLVGPWLVARRTGGQHLLAAAPAPAGEVRPGRLASALGGMSAGLARRGAVVLPVVGVITVGLGAAAVQIPTEFDVRDFFSADSGFVVGLDKLDEHVGAQGGEPATILVEGDLDTVASLAAMQAFTDEVDGIADGRLATADDGSVAVQGGVLDVVTTTMASPAAVQAVETRTGILPVDDDGDGLPDTDAQVAAVVETALADGVPLADGTLALTAGDVAEVYAPADAEGPDATTIGFGVPGSREVAVVEAAEALLADPVARLADGVDDPSGGEAAATLTGSPFVRQGGLEAISDSLLLSLPIAIALCFAIAAASMRSLRYGAIAVIPIVLVVAWLYGVMELTGFAINLVTGTIGAVSIGIGIDFAIHYLMRYREELGRTGDRLVALRATGEGTGLALVASSASSILGFAILAFAPMPLFASYGLLTAIMIAMATAASLVVLPSLLYVATRDGEPASPSADPAPHQVVSPPRAPAGV